MRAERLFMKPSLFDWKNVSRVSSYLAITGMIGLGILFYVVCPIYFGFTQKYEDTLTKGDALLRLINFSNTLLAGIATLFIALLVLGYFGFFLSWIIRLKRHICSKFA